MRARSIWSAAAAGLRPRQVRPAQRTGYRPGQVVQFDWAEMPTRPRIAGVERRVYALVASLPFSGAQTAFFSFDMTLESFLEGHVRAFDWLGGVPRECVYDNLRSAVARRDADRWSLEPAVPAPARPLRLSRDRVHAGDAAREGLGRGRGALPQDRLLAGPAVRRRCASSTRSTPTGATGSATAAGTRPAASSSPSGWREERAALRPLPPARVRLSRGAGRCGCRSTATSLRRLLLPRAGRARAPARRAALRPRPGLDLHRGAEVAALPALLRAGRLAAAADACGPSRRRRRRRCRSRSRRIAAPELADYAELCA